MPNRLKIISWNVNGIRAALRKGFLDYVRKENPDIICLQETKANREQVEFELPGYEQYWYSAQKKGYAGTAIFSKAAASKTMNGIIENGRIENLADKYGDPNNEGRVLTAEYEKFFLVTVYTPNSKPDLSRLDLRFNVWDPKFLKYVKELDASKPVIFCGDLNVAHKEIDLARPLENRGKHGFTDEEREGFDKILAAGFIDSFRKFNQEPHQYSWWSNFGNARQKNLGWRIDYFCVSEKLANNLKSAFIQPAVMGSDHCPVGIEIEV